MALDLNDKTVNGNTLTNVGAGDATTSLAFAGTSHAADLELGDGDYLYAGDSVSLSITGDITLECLIKFETFPSDDNMWLLAKWEDTGNLRSYTFGLTDSAGVKILRFIISPDGNYNVLNDAQTTWVGPALDTWYHLAVTWTASTKKASFYIDGTQNGVDFTTSTGTIYDGATRLSVGAFNTANTPAGFTDGVIDECRVWNVVRTQTEINNNKLNELTGLETGLKAYYPFEVLDVATRGAGRAMLMGIGN